MKTKRWGVVVPLVLLVSTMAMAADSNPWERKLPFKEATIHYLLSGMEAGTETLYIRDYGRNTATYRIGKMNMLGTTAMNETIAIESPEWVYHFDLTNHTGTKSVNPQKYMIEEYHRLSAAEQKQVSDNIEKIGLPMAEAIGGTVEQKVTKILGYDCDRTQMMGTTVYTLHGAGIPLKIESNVMGLTMRQEATAVNEGGVDQKYFEPPQGIVAVMDPEADTMARTLARQTMDTLKSPDGAKKMQEETPMNPMVPQGSGQQMSPAEQQEMEQAMQMLKGMMGEQK
ncbi:MAG: hypothetical protein ABIJ50_06600 [Pseudomonadota bacterium]